MYRIISSTEIRKWPLYLRTVKQILRSQTPPFDERAYGFPTLIDLLRASHKEGAFRVERDRQGVIRVFQSGSAGLPGGKAPDAAAASVATSEPSMAAVVELAEVATPSAVETPAPAAPEKKRRARTVRASKKTKSPVRKPKAQG
jgi:hypothetical protein